MIRSVSFSLPIVTHIQDFLEKAEEIASIFFKHLQSLSLFNFSNTLSYIHGYCMSAVREFLKYIKTAVKSPGCVMAFLLNSAQLWVSHLLLLVTHCLEASELPS